MLRRSDECWLVYRGQEQRISTPCAPRSGFATLPESSHLHLGKTDDSHYK